MASLGRALSYTVCVTTPTGMLLRRLADMPVLLHRSQSSIVANTTAPPPLPLGPQRPRIGQMAFAPRRSPRDRTAGSTARTGISGCCHCSAKRLHLQLGKTRSISHRKNEATGAATSSLNVCVNGEDFASWRCWSQTVQLFGLLPDTIRYDTIII